MRVTFLLMEGITKTFPGVLALDSVTFEMEKGEVCALVGENGAGKSTLIKILSGVHRPDRGKIFLEGKERDFRSPIDAIRAGVAVIYQELSLAENLPVYANVFLGKEPWKFGINHSYLEERTKLILEELGFDIDPKIEVGKLNVSEKQLVAIAKALAYDAKIIVMDEPTATLTEYEVERLFEIIKRLKKRGVSVVFISHRLDEIFEVADKVVILRDGKKVGEGKLEDFSRDDIINLMVGRKIEDMYPKYNSPEDDVAFRVKNFEVPGYVSKLSFEVRKGEIFGVAGLVGCGKSELALGLFGAMKSRFDEMMIFGRKIGKLKSPIDALRNGLVLIPEERKKHGLVLGMSVVENIALPNVDKVSNPMYLSWRKTTNLAESAVRKFNIKTPSVRQLVKNLSGGNQQKVVIGKYIFREPDVIILAEPTRGIDVGAKVEVYRMMNDLANLGKAILFISSELPEIVSLSDRVMVLHRGKMTALLHGDQITQENILKAATGVM